MHAYKKEILEQLLSGDTFSKNDNYRKLLIYLFEADKPKELNIAIDVFGRDHRFNPNDDPVVRVYAHNLRKKLDAYYATEGKCDKIRVTLPKGHYVIQLEEKRKKYKTIPMMRWSVCVLLLSIILVLLPDFIHWQKIKHVTKKHPVWQEMLRNEKPVILALGDHFFYSQKDSSGKQIVMRDLTINSLTDFDRFLKSRPEAAPLDYTYYDKNNVWPIPAVMSVLLPYGVDVSLKRASTLSPTDLQENHIVFAGHVNTLGKFKHFFSYSLLNISEYPARIFVEKNGETQTYESVGEYSDFHTDYGVVLKVPGPNENVILIFADFHGTGNNGTSQFLCSEKSAAALREILPNGATYFELLFRVNGLNLTSFEHEIVHADVLEDEARE